MNSLADEVIILENIIAKSCFLSFPVRFCRWKRPNLKTEFVHGYICRVSVAPIFVN